MNLFVIIIVALIANGATAAQFDICVRGQQRSATETCIVDGDTLWLDGTMIRLKDFDTPEPQSNICGGDYEVALARQATAVLRQMLNDNDWTIEYIGKEPRGKRTLATIRIDGVDVGDLLIAAGLARAWPDGDEFWCR